MPNQGWGRRSECIRGPSRHPQQHGQETPAPDDALAAEWAPCLTSCCTGSSRPTGSTGCSADRHARTVGWAQPGRMILIRSSAPSLCGSRTAALHVAGAARPLRSPRRGVAFTPTTTAPTSTSCSPCMRNERSCSCDVEPRVTSPRVPSTTSPRLPGPSATAAWTSTPTYWPIACGMCVLPGWSDPRLALPEVPLGGLLPHLGEEVSADFQARVSGHWPMFRAVESRIVEVSSNRCEHPHCTWRISNVQLHHHFRQHL
jgi:hypothetical protein